LGFVHSFERERERAPEIARVGVEEGQGRARESPKRTSAESMAPAMGLDPTILRSQPEPKPRVGGLTNSAP